MSKVSAHWLVLPEDREPEVVVEHVFDAVSIFDTWSPEPWLRNLVVSMSTEYGKLCSAYYQAASAGAVIRLFSSTSETAQESMQRLLAGEDSPCDRARKWMRKAPKPWLMEVQTTALLEADSLHNDIVQVLGPRSLMIGTGVHYECVARRDNLESVLVALQEVRGSIGLEAVLDRVDTEGRLLGVPDDWTAYPRLAAVSWMEPASWWGQFSDNIDMEKHDDGK